MARSCDICGGMTSFLNSFRCQDGVICKRCYKIVSNDFTSTIASSTLIELKKRYIRNASPIDMGEGGFQTTRKIGSFLLLDEKSRKLCLISNRSLTGQYSRPEVYTYDALNKVELVSIPELSLEQLETLAEEKKSQMIVRRLMVRLWFKSGETRDIVVLPTAVRTSSLAFRRSVHFVRELIDTFRMVLS